MTIFSAYFDRRYAHPVQRLKLTINENAARITNIGALMYDRQRVAHQKKPFFDTCSGVVFAVVFDDDVVVQKVYTVRVYKIIPVR